MKMPGFLKKLTLKKVIKAVGNVGKAVGKNLPVAGAIIGAAQDIKSGLSKVKITKSDTPQPGPIVTFEQAKKPVETSKIVLYGALGLGALFLLTKRR